MDGWISVDDRLPITRKTFNGPYETMDVIVTDGVEVWTESFTAGGIPKFWSGFTSGRITHWQPLPTPPKALAACRASPSIPTE